MSWKQNQDMSPARIANVPHEVGGMTMVEDPTQCLGEHIHGIHDSGKVHQDDILHWSPMLKCKACDFDMSRVISRSTKIDDLDRGIVVFVDGCRLSLSAPQFVKNETQTLGDFRGCIGTCEFSCRGALHTDRLNARAMSHETTGQTTSVFRCRTTVMQLVSVCCICVSNQVVKMRGRRNDGQRVIELHGNMRHLRKRCGRFRTAMHNAPVFSCVCWRQIARCFRGL